jgi:hypothetical protein
MRIVHRAYKCFTPPTAKIDLSTDYGRTEIALSGRLVFAVKHDLASGHSSGGNCQLADYFAAVVGGMGAEICVEQPGEPDLYQLLRACEREIRLHVSRRCFANIPDNARRAGPGSRAARTSAMSGRQVCGQAPGDPALPQHIRGRLSGLDIDGTARRSSLTTSVV